MVRRLYAGNLSFNLTETELRSLFARAGGVERAEIVTDRWTGMSRGFGFVDMMTEEDAEAALAELNGVEAKGRMLRVAMAKPREASREVAEAARPDAQAPRGDA